jgi:transposase
MSTAVSIPEPRSTANAPLPALDELPNDPELLKHLVLDLLATLHEERRDKEQLRHRLELLLQRLYGSRNERFEPSQPLLFDLVSAASVEETAASAPPAETVAPRRRCRPHGRRPLPENLPRRPVEHVLSEAERICSCGQLRVDIGVDQSEQLDWQPASLFVWQHRVHKYACPVCAACVAQTPVTIESHAAQSGGVESMTESGSSEGGLVDSTKAPASTTENSARAPADASTGAGNATPGPVVISATKPAAPIARGLPGPGLLANVIVSKYTDHLPLHRQEGIYERQGVLLPRSTTCDWLAASAELLRPLYNLMVSLVLQSRWLHTDDTPVKNQQPPDDATPTARLWAYLGDTFHPYNIFDFTSTRKRDGPQQFLAKFHGYLHADAFSGYDALYLSQRATGEPAIVEVACNAHARRKFYEARGSDAFRAHQALAYYGQLYEIERHARERNEEQRLRMRQDLALPILAKFKTWLEAQRKDVLPKCPMAEAIGYALNNWTALIRYTEAGFLSIDNNVAEREMKRIAIGRKNWLFVGSERGGHTAAVLLSFTATCQRLGVEPWAYLQDVLTRLPSTTSAQLADLLPDRWQAARAAQVRPPTPGSAPPSAISGE